MEHTMYTIATPRNLLEEFFRDFERPTAPATTKFRPAVDVAQVEGGFVLRTELPGIPKEAVKVEVKEQVLTLSGEKPTPTYETKGYRYSEIGYGKFERTFQLSDTIDVDTVQAKFENGVLEIRLALKPEVGARQVQVL
jgi:HSP20 family protein